MQILPLFNLLIKSLLQSGAKRWLLLALISLLPINAFASHLALGPDIPYAVMSDTSQQQTVEQVYAQLRHSEEIQKKNIFTRLYPYTTLAILQTTCSFFCR